MLLWSMILAALLTDGILAVSVSSATEVPFHVGESASYRVRYGILGRVGTATMDIPRLDTVRGRSALHLVYTLKGGVPGARIDNRIEAWLDVENVFSHRFVQRTREVRFKRDRTREFFPDEFRWTGETNGNEESGRLTTRLPLDDVGFLYALRAMQLDVGTEHVLDRYWDDKGNPVRLKVLRRETVRVPAGTYTTVVVQPIIKTSGLFAEGGEAEVYVSEGKNREVVMLRAKVSFGTLRLELEKYVPGQRARFFH